MSDFCLDCGALVGTPHVSDCRNYGGIVGEAPRCDACFRIGFDAKIGDTCGMIQPNGEVCMGTFQSRFTALESDLVGRDDGHLSFHQTGEELWRTGPSDEAAAIRQATIDHVSEIAALFDQVPENGTCLHLSVTPANAARYNRVLLAVKYILDSNYLREAK